MKRSCLRFAVCLAFFCATSQLQATMIHAYATATVLDGPGIANSGATFATASDSLSGYPLAPGGYASASATAQADPSRLVVVSASAYIPAGYTFAESVAGSYAEWSDSLILTVPKGGRLPSYINGYFYVSGNVQAIQSAPLDPSITQDTQVVIGSQAYGGVDGTGANAVVRFGAKNGLFTYGWDQITVTSGRNGSNHFEGTYHIEIGINGSGVGNWNVGLVADAQAQSGGLAATNYLDPPEFDILSFLLPDGKTPESEGFGLSFASGMNSPNNNIAATPEPASLTLLAFGGVALLGYAGLRRRRKAASA